MMLNWTVTDNNLAVAADCCKKKLLIDRMIGQTMHVVADVHLVTSVITAECIVIIVAVFLEELKAEKVERRRSMCYERVWVSQKITVITIILHHILGFAVFVFFVTPKC